MARYAAFLRGMNVAGRRATAAELCACCEEIGLRDVASFRASGNLVFGSEDGDETSVAARLEEALKRSLGYEVPVFLRTAAQVRAIAGHEPFPPAEVEASKGKLQVALLLRPPPAPARRKALALATEQDRLAVRGRELYWLPRGTMSDSELGMKTVGEILGPATVRTKGTMEQIAERFFARRRRSG